jgi:uncharacterized protein
MRPYVVPWYFKNGLVQTVLVSLHHGDTWAREGENSPLAPKLPPVPWQEQTFICADGVPIAGRYARQPKTAPATLILCYGITGMMDTSWYVHYLARKAYAQGYDVVIYDWRGHGRSAQLSPVPPSDGWRDGEDILYIARQAHALGCARSAIPVGFSLGGQLVLWSLKAAVDLGETAILGACTICPNLQSTWSLDNLRTTFVGTILESALVKELRREVKRRLQYYPETVPPGILERVNYISEFDDEMVIDYYGFSSVEDYYKQTSGLYLLEDLKLPHLILYAEDDPMFDPRILQELRLRSGGNPQATLVITPHGGHVGYVGVPGGDEDEFWSLNRVLEYCAQLLG